jgi:lipopolysaccharide export system protein LptC
MAQRRLPEEGTDAAASGPRSRAYARAKRHSRAVRFFKIAIPTGAVLAVGAVAAIAFLDPFGRLSGLSVGPIRISGTQLTMENPRLTGFRKDNRGYEITASAATQDVRKPHVVELTDLRGRLVMDEGGGLARLASDFGVFDTTKEAIDLRQNIRVQTDAGQEVLLKSAAVDFKAGTVRSREPVQVRFAGGSVDADQLDVNDHGKVLTFTGRVRTVFEPAAERPGLDKQAQAELPAPLPVAENTLPPRAAMPPTTSVRR